MIISICTILICCGVFAYAINSIGEIFKDFGQLEIFIKKKMYSISCYMNQKNVNKDV